MVSRREPRKDIRVPIRIFGTDVAGKAFSENVFTVNVSRGGAMVIEIRTQLKIGEIIGLTYGKSKGRYEVRWVGQAGTQKENLAGLQNVKADELIWDFPLPEATPEDAIRTRALNERREHPRCRCNLSVELHPASGESRAWGRVADVSLGGCFVEMPSPFKEGTQIRLALWIQDKKIWALAKVVSSRLGSGIGLQFLEMKNEDRTELKRFLDSLPGMRR
jgi:PilZ domain